MTATLISDIIADVILELSQTPGVVTQIYATPKIQQFIQDAFTLEFDEEWWPDYMKWFAVTLDGTNGYITSDLTGAVGSCTSYDDVAQVFPVGSNTRLRQMPPRWNPFTITGGSPIYMAPSDDTALHPARPFRVFPTTSAGGLNVWARLSPTIPFAQSDTVYIDRLLLTFDAAWMYCTDDGTVPAQVERFKALAQKRRNQVKSALSQQALQLDPRYYTNNDMWWEMPS